MHEEFEKLLMVPGKRITHVEYYLSLKVTLNTLFLLAPDVRTFRWIGFLVGTTTSPVTSVPRFSEKKRARYISDDEYTRLIEAASPTFRVIINMAYLTCQRIGDVLKIKQSDISPDGITVIQEKTGKKLKVAMTPALEENIRAARRLHGRITSTYLLGQRNGKIRNYKDVRYLLQRDVDKAGLDDIHLHDFRAKAITDDKKLGHDPQALAGHTTEAQTVRYLRDKEIPLVYGPRFKQ